MSNHFIRINFKIIGSLNYRKLKVRKKEKVNVCKKDSIERVSYFMMLLN